MIVYEDTAMKKFYSILIILCVFHFFSCAMFDGVSDLKISENVPDEIIIFNNARVSTLKSIDGKINRSGSSVYDFHFNVDIPAGYTETIKLNDFILQEGDKVFIIKAKFSWDM